MPMPEEQSELAPTEPTEQELDERVAMLEQHVVWLANLIRQDREVINALTTMIQTQVATIEQLLEVVTDPRAVPAPTVTADKRVAGEDVLGIVKQIIMSSGPRDKHTNRALRQALAARGIERNREAIITVLNILVADGVLVPAGEYRGRYYMLSAAALKARDV